jgi:hypothetical protein
MRKSIGAVTACRRVFCVVASVVLLTGAGPAAAEDEIGGTQRIHAAATDSAPLTDNSQALGIRPATERVQTTPTVIDQAIAALKLNARQECAQWEDRTFDEFEKSTFREPFAHGKYIVSGDIAIPDREQLREFFESHIRGQPAEAEPGALIVHRVEGRDAIWDSNQKRLLTYCVSTRFGARYERVISDMRAAANAWEMAADVDFIHARSEDANCTARNMNVVFDIRPINVNGQYLARAFFPKDLRPERNILIDESAFELDPDGSLQLVGIIRHELGHTLGWRHEHTRPESGACFEDNNWRPLTDYDDLSVMHYPQCNGGGDWSLTLTDMDRNGAACVYGPAPGFEIDPQICRAVES